MKNKIKYIIGLPVVIFCILLVNFILKTHGNVPTQLFFAEISFLGLLITVVFFMVFSLLKRKSILKYMGVCLVVISCIVVFFYIIKFYFSPEQPDLDEFVIYSSISFFGLLASIIFFLIFFLYKTIKKDRIL
ncbi:MAG: hypothetical protein HW401_596 [Parcubacteria group bacterium]|nr:hypothetical protein [Parcubacteria group bacterium]